MSAEIKRLKDEVNRLTYELRDAQAARDDAAMKAKEADLALSMARAKLVAAKEEADRKLPQCKIVQTQSWRPDRTVDACIVGVTSGGKLRVRQILSDHVTLFSWREKTGRYECGSGDFRGHLICVPSEFMPESAR